MKKLLLLAALLSLTWNSTSQTEVLTNGSFESGALGPWTAIAIGTVDAGPSSCIENWRVQSDSFDVCTIVPDVTPTDGTSAAFTSFDTDAPNTEWIIEQSVAIPSTVVAADFSFDFAAEFDFSFGGAITIPRELRIELLDNADMPVALIFQDNTFIGTGPLSVSYSQNIDLSGALGPVLGTTAKIRISAIVPEVATGPSKAMIDNVSFIIDDGLNVEDFTLENALQVSPNPSNGAFTINYDGLEALQSATLYDITGKQLSQFDLRGQTGPRDLSVNIPAGIYLLKIDSDLSSTTKKLIIQ